MLEFLESSIGYEAEPRPIWDTDVVPEDFVRSGDAVLMTTFQGLNALVMYGTGSLVGHSGIAMWIGDQLYVLESQSDMVWPREGVQANLFRTFKEWLRESDGHAIVLPLREDVRERFNASAALDFFLSINGMPYGMHNYLFGWLDTPISPWPALLPPEILPVLMGVLEGLSPEYANILVGEALNHRLGTRGLSLSEVAAEAARQGKTLAELYSVPEKDGWEYSDGYNYVCSSFVVGMYKAGGLFGDLEVQATEFGPRDLYMLDFFDKNASLPEGCLAADPDLPYCQIYGKYRIRIPFEEYSSVTPYANMNERCPATPPNGGRLEGC